ncbi:MAG: YihY/virulence factor BrkB family protein [Oscillochloris sp.]|nr:YihY/virulence factor BrkB family protein [Oscillochloris sp.]
MHLRDIQSLLADTWAEWNTDRATRLGASLAFFTVLSLSPLLILAVAIAGIIFGQVAAQGELLAQARSLIGLQGAEAIQTMIESANRPGAGIVATIISVITLLFGASGVFGELQAAMNTIWGVEPRPDRGFMGMLKERLFSFSLVLSVGFLLLVSLILSSILSALGGQLRSVMPSFNVIWQVVEVVVSFCVITLIFAALYKYIPDVHINWRDVWVGAIVTSLLFTIGRFVLGLYLGNSSTTSVYGAAGSLVVVLLWVFYSAQIIFFGAEFTQVYANRFGSQILPSDNAVAIGKWNPNAAAQQAVNAEAKAHSAHPSSVQPAGLAITQRQEATQADQLATPLSLLVPISFAMGFMIGLYRRIRG